MIVEKWDEWERSAKNGINPTLIDRQVKVTYNPHRFIVTLQK